MPHWPGSQVYYTKLSVKWTLPFFKNLKKMIQMTNGPIYKTEIESQVQKTNLRLQRGKDGKRDKLGDWDWHVYTIIYKIDN